MVDIEIPKFYGARMREDLKASSTAVNIHRLCPYFYTFGIKLLNL